MRRSTQGPDLAMPASPVPAIVLPVVPKYLPGGIGTPSERISYTSRPRGQLCGKPGRRDGLPWVLTTSEACYTSKPLSEASPQNTGAPGDPLLQTSGPMPSLSRWGSACQRSYPKLGKAGIRAHVFSLVLRPFSTLNHGPLLIIQMGGPALGAELWWVCGKMQESLKGTS